jgi:cell division protein FtsN
MIFIIPFILRPEHHKDLKKDNEQNDVDSTSNIVDSTNVPDQIVPDIEETESPQEYSIVVGSFKSHEKAEKLKEKLNQSNFDCNTQILENGLIRVTVGSGYSELELKEEFDSLVILGYEPWIIKLDELASN